MSAGSQGRQFPWWAYKVLWAIIALIILVPFAISLVLGPIVELLGGCQFNTYTRAPCGVLGINFTPLIATTTWYTIILFLSAPIWIPGLFVFFVFMLLHRQAWVS